MLLKISHIAADVSGTACSADRMLALASRLCPSPRRPRDHISLLTALEVTYAAPNATKETSRRGPREPREPPAAVKAASRPPSEDTPERFSPNEAVPIADGEGAVAPRVTLLARTSKGSPTRSQGGLKR